MNEIGVGTRIGDYRVVALLGQGGMGTVYRAEHAGSGAQVALKLLSDQLSSDSSFRRRFEREARYARELEHPHIVGVREIGSEGARMYMVMPEIRGTDLGVLLALEGWLEPRRALVILTQVASALDALHGRGVLHRDVKPGNVIVASGEGPEPAGRAYLTDFGLSKDPTRDSRQLTAVGEFVGTYQYVAPEQVLGREYDHRVDTYALGCVLYECLTGQPPFVRERALDVLDAHVEDPPPLASALRAHLPAALDAVVVRAMAKQAADRFATATELVDAAAAALAGTAHAPLASGRRHALRLLATAGPSLGAEMLVSDELLIGRDRSGDGNLAGDPEISRRHARIWRAEDGFLVEDVGSTNGTFVSGGIVASPRPLAQGERLQVGGTALLVEGVVPLAEAPLQVPAAPASERSVQTARRAISLRLEIDFAAREARVTVGDGGSVLRLRERGGRRVAEPS